MAKEPEGVESRVAWFGQRLRELREVAGLSRKDLADRAGMQSEAGVRNLEQGIRSPSWETVLRLASALGVSCEAFTQAPAPREPAGPGRPAKPAEPAPVATKKPRRKKGE
jgi:transcriptional regulator with XRE-family HTH domain